MIAVPWKKFILHPIKELIFHFVSCKHIPKHRTFTLWSWGPFWIVSLDTGTTRYQCVVFTCIVIEEVTVLATEVG